MALRVVLEENPKWQLLQDVLLEIHQTQESLSSQSPSGSGETSSPPILVIVRDERTAVQVQEYLSDGGRSILESSFRTHLIKSKREKVCVCVSFSDVAVSSDRLTCVCMCLCVF